MGSYVVALILVSNRVVKSGPGDNKAQVCQCAFQMARNWRAKQWIIDTQMSGEYVSLSLESPSIYLQRGLMSSTGQMLVPPVKLFSDLSLHFLDKKAQWVLERLNGLADGLKQESACRSRETSTEVVISISNSEPDRCSTHTHTQRSLWRTGFVGINFLTERQKVMRQWKIERIPNGLKIFFSSSGRAKGARSRRRYIKNKAPTLPNDVLNGERYWLHQF